MWGHRSDHVALLGGVTVVRRTERGSMLGGVMPIEFGMERRFLHTAHTVSRTRRRGVGV